jgi:hypothetical protein
LLPVQIPSSLLPTLSKRKIGQYRMRELPRALTFIGGIVQSVLLCSCAVNDDRFSAVFVSPAGEQYEFYDCKQLTGVMSKIKDTERELKAQMAKAGTVASGIGGYKLDYANQHGMFVAARNAARDKKCELSPELAVDEHL